MTATIHVEGGGSRDFLKAECRRAFKKFFRNAGFADRLLKIRPCGARDEAYRSFRRAVAANKGQAHFLLVDAEGPVAAGTPWEHLGWVRPSTAAVDSAFLMVQCMESWFYADKEALERLLGRDFNARALPGDKNIERIPKEDVLSGLKRATRNVKGGRYDKGEHSFKILEQIDPQKVTAASPQARRLMDALREELGN